MLKKIVLVLMVLLFVFSLPAAAAEKQVVTDQLGFKVEVPVRAARIVVVSRTRCWWRSFTSWLPSRLGRR